MNRLLWGTLGTILLAWTIHSMADETVASGKPADMPGTQLGTVRDYRISESSGIALSLRQPDAVWLHNDSGSPAWLFLVGLDGTTRAVLKLSGVSRALDWEDMASFQIDGRPWLAVGDIGDNSHERTLQGKEKTSSMPCRVYIFPEPDMAGTTERQIELQTTIRFEFEDGPRNCESIAVDAERREILLISKSKPEPLNGGLYRIPLTLEPGSTTCQAQRIADLNIPYVTAMDVSPDGRHLVVLAPEGAMLWERSGDESWDTAVKKPCRLIKLPPHPNGETICFGRTPSELLIHSEQKYQPLWSVLIPDNPAPPTP